MQWKSDVAHHKKKGVSELKRRITIEQLQELTEEQKSYLKSSWKPQAGDMFVIINHNRGAFLNNYVTVFSDDSLRNFKSIPETYYPLLDISQMIEILTKENDYIEMHGILDEGSPWGLFGVYGDYSNDELCDALWEAVRSIL